MLDPQALGTWFKYGVYTCMYVGMYISESYAVYPTIHVHNSKTRPTHSVAFVIFISYFRDPLPLNVTILGFFLLGTETCTTPVAANTSGSNSTSYCSGSTGTVIKNFPGILGVLDIGQSSKRSFLKSNCNNLLSNWCRALSDLTAVSLWYIRRRVPLISKR